MALLVGGTTLVFVWFLGSSSIRIFEIFEARTAVGGRSRTVYPFTADDLAVDLGSAWTYEDTKVHQILLDHKIPFDEID